ncbi:MAG: copper-binding protein [Alphaproteobacteria bacterium]|nr:copper-binding protein [Alphaproteobacteria bacterium]
MTKLVLAAATLSLMTTGAWSSEFTKGVVKKVDLKAKKVTVIHEELKSLDMPAMTMVFRTATDEMLASLKDGQTIEFVADRVNGKLTITEIR